MIEEKSTRAVVDEWFDTAQAAIGEWVATAWTATGEGIATVWSTVREATVWSAVGEGIVIGVSISLILWAFERVKGRRERKDQIRHIATILAGYKTRVLEPGEILVDTAWARDQQTWLMYKTMRIAIDRALSGRATRLSHDEITQIEEPLLQMDLIFQQYDLHPSVGPDLSPEDKSSIRNHSWKVIWQRYDNIAWLKAEGSSRSDTKWGQTWGWIQSRVKFRL